MTSENVKTAFEKGGRNPPDANLYNIAKDLLDFLNGFECLHAAKKQILDRCKIETQAGHNCWSADVIEKAWKETKRMEKKDQEHWAFVIMVQVIKSLISDEGKQNPTQEESGVVSESPYELGVRNNKRKCDLGSTGENEKCKKDISSQSTAEHGTMRAAGGDEQHTGQTIYIRVPFSEMIPNGQEEQNFQNVISPYKLIDGVPETERDSVIRRRKSYVMSFNRQTRNANWVYEILNRSTTADNHVELKTFGDPYHKGHLAAAANHRWCREASADADMIDNIVPQHKNLNTGPWKCLENCCRTRATVQNNIRNVHVYSGPLYRSDMNPQVLNGKRVPSHFFKVIIEENVDGTVDPPRYYLFPNEDVSIEKWKSLENVEKYRMINHGTENERAITIEDIQRDSGLTFIDIRQNAVAREITGTLHGEDGNAEPLTADIRVMICS